MMHGNRSTLLLVVFTAACGAQERVSSLPAQPTVPVVPVTPTPAAPVDPLDPIVRVDLSNALFACVSEPVDYAGGHYRFEFRTDSELAALNIDFVGLPQGLQVDEAEAPAAERVWSAQLPLSESDFRGFETGNAWLVLDGDFEGGFAEARMGRMDPEREILVADRRDLAVTCFQSEVPMPARYDAATGACLNADGEPAVNVVPLRFVLATGLGQCARFEGRINGDAFGYPIYRGIDLRGADLDGAELSFASFHEARFEGANLEGFSFGYAVVDGAIDAHTRLPTEMFCDSPATDDHFRCMQ